MRIVNFDIYDSLASSIKKNFKDNKLAILIVKN